MHVHLSTVAWWDLWNFTFFTITFSLTAEGCWSMKTKTWHVLSSYSSTCQPKPWNTHCQKISIFTPYSHPPLHQTRLGLDPSHGMACQSKQKQISSLFKQENINCRMRFLTNHTSHQWYFVLKRKIVIK